jgi:hypothetical protein
MVSTRENSDVYISNLYTIGATQMIVPTNSNMSTVLAKDNTNENGHPYLSVVASWIDIDSDDQSAPSDSCLYSETPDNDCFDPGTLTVLCDPTLTYSSLEALQSASSTLPSVCLDGYAIQVVMDMLNEALNNYTNVNNGYDDVFKYYVEAVKGMIPNQIDTLMQKNGGGNQFFSCQVKGSSTAGSCPADLDSMESWQVTYIPKDLDGFYALLNSTYGINSTVSIWPKNMSSTSLFTLLILVSG